MKYELPAYTNLFNLWLSFSCINYGRKRSISIFKININFINKNLLLIINHYSIYHKFFLIYN